MRLVVVLLAVLACTPPSDRPAKTCVTPLTLIDLPVDDIPFGRDLYQPTCERFCAPFAHRRQLVRCYRAAGEYQLTCEWVPGSDPARQGRICDMH